MDTNKIPWGFVLHLGPGALWVDIAMTEEDSRVEAERNEVVVPLIWSDAAYLSGFLTASMRRHLEKADA